VLRASLLACRRSWEPLTRRGAALSEWRRSTMTAERCAAGVRSRADAPTAAGPVLRRFRRHHLEPHLRAYYDHLIARGKLHKVAMVATMRRLLLILNAIIKTGTPWKHHARTPLELYRLSTSPQAGCFISIPEPVDLWQPFQPQPQELTSMTVASLASERRDKTRQELPEWRIQNHHRTKAGGKGRSCHWRGPRHRTRRGDAARARGCQGRGQ